MMNKLDRKSIIPICLSTLIVFSLFNMWIPKVKAAPDATFKFGYEGCWTAGAREDNYMVGTNFTFIDPVQIQVTLTSITFHYGSQTGNPQKIKYALYNSTLGLIASTGEYVGTGGSTLNFANPPTLNNNTVYWLVAWGSQWYFYYKTSSPGGNRMSFNLTQSYTGNFPSTLSPSGYTDSIWDIHGTYSTCEELVDSYPMANADWGLGLATLHPSADNITDSFTYAPNNWFGVHWFVNAIEVTPETVGAWVGVNCSSYVPEGMTGVILDRHSLSGRKVDVRHPDSTDDFYEEGGMLISNQAGMVAVGINSSRCFDAKIQEADDYNLWLLGYTDDSVTFFVNAIDQSTDTTGSWVAVNLSENVSSDATGIFYRIIGDPANTYEGRVREAGSTDNMTIWKVKTPYVCGGIGLNETKYVEQFITNIAADLYIVGYTNSSSFTWYTNHVEIAPTSYGTWVDVDAELPQGATGLFLTSVNIAPSTTKHAEIRHPDSTDDRYGYSRVATLTNGYCTQGCGMNALGFFGGKIQSAEAFELYVKGYTKNITQTYDATLTKAPATIVSLTVNSVSWSNYTFSENIVTVKGLTEDCDISITYMDYSSVAGQTFVTNGTFKLTKVQFYMQASGSPTGTDAKAVVYETTGTHGVNATPTSVIAESDVFDVSDIDGTNRVYTFKFCNGPTLQSGTAYALAFQNPTSGTIDTSNWPNVRVDKTNPTHDGNSFRYKNGAWDLTYADWDVIFYFYGIKWITIGEFDAPVNVDGDRWFSLKARIHHVEEVSYFVNATIEISGSIILKWDNATNTFSEYADPNDFCLLNASASTKTTINSTAHELAWQILLGLNYPEGPVDVVVDTTKVFDSQGYHASGNMTALFTLNQPSSRSSNPEWTTPPPGFFISAETGIIGTVHQGTSKNFNVTIIWTGNMRDCMLTDIDFKGEGTEWLRSKLDLPKELSVQMTQRQRLDVPITLNIPAQAKLGDYNVNIVYTIKSGMYASKTSSNIFWSVTVGPMMPGGVSEAVSIVLLISLIGIALMGVKKWRRH